MAVDSAKLPRHHVLREPAEPPEPSQAYFWTKQWQSGEREAEQDIRKGRVRKFKNVQDLMKDLRG